ncbi:ribosomal protein L22/L17 [Catenaria anguillulae PL171]|uniref:Ribosomal protein L22/L17 n=1 Tax=Catenaria anguillulae PL171 TaxID=765915 RepID=A0A1Y2HEQ9_9FUNG|nr:ribosomal protein L22/L17 [Catenaria anguillulae PL171]
MQSTLLHLLRRPLVLRPPTCAAGTAAVTPFIGLRFLSTCSPRLAAAASSSKKDSEATISKSASPLFEDAIQENEDKTIDTGLPAGLDSLAALPANETYISNSSYTISTGDMQYSPQKLNMLARQIKGLPLKEAIDQMRFATRKPAPQIVRTLNHILHNTRQIKFGDPSLPDRGLVVAQAWVGKGIYSHGINIHGRGRFGRLTSPRSHMKIEVKVANVRLAPNRGNTYQGKRAFLPPKKEARNVKMILPEKPIYNKWKKLFYDA